MEMTALHWTILADTYANGTVAITCDPHEHAAIADLVQAGYLTDDGRFTEVGRRAWRRSTPDQPAQP